MLATGQMTKNIWGSDYWDGISGARLDPGMAKAARQGEMVEVYKHDLHTKVPWQQCWDEAGKKPIGVRWVDINKGDALNPEYRPRLVAKDFKRGAKRDDLFAGTPPLETLKLLLRWAVTEGIGYFKGNKADG